MFFDGVCGLCNGWVNFCIDIDEQKQLRLLPFKERRRQRNIAATFRAILEATIIFYSNNIFYTKSTAVLMTLSRFRGLWYLFIVFFLILKFFRILF